MLPIIVAMMRPVRQSLVIADQVTMKFNRPLNATASFPVVFAKSMQLSVTWRCPIDDGADVCDVGPRYMDDDAYSNKPWQLRLLAQLPPRFQSGGPKAPASA